MKRIAIMQPYFLPYVGYFSLIKNTDEFILFDSVQFIRHGWIERNRILKQNDGWLYIKVPLVKGHRDTLIKDVLIDNNQEWKNKIISQLESYKKIAPFYKEVLNLVEEIFSKEYTNIVALDRFALETISKYLNIKTNIKVFSKMNLEIETPTAPDEWALNICKSLGNITEYWNPPGGQDFFDKKKYDKANIELRFQIPTLIKYNQKRTPFEPGLSILDVMMFNTPEEINIMLDHYELT